MNWSVTFDPFLPVNAIAVLGLVGLALVAIAVFARVRGGLLRAALLALLVTTLLNPSIRSEDREPLNDIAVMIIDRSNSQLLGDRSARTDQAEVHFRSEVERIGATELRTATVTSGLNADEDGTHAFRALKEALADVPPERFAGALIVTDGQIHDVPDSVSELGYDGPIHGVITGDRHERDRRIVLETAPRFGIVGQKQTVQFRVEESGRTGTRAPVTVNVNVDGQIPRELSVNIGELTEVQIDIAHGGQILTELTVESFPGELTAQNNRAVIVTAGVRDRLRVLLISGEPHPGERTWRNLLKADASVDLVHFTILRPPEKQDGTPIKELSLIAFPTRELFIEKLQEFDLIIFDRYQRRGVLPLTYIANIASYVLAGGAVLIAAGPDYAEPASIYRTPLASVLPAVPTGKIIEQPFRAHITELGERHPVTRDLPGGDRENPTWGRWFRLIDSDPAFGHSVMSGPGGRALMVLARKKKGRVAQLMSDHAWLWARGYEGGGPQAELLRRMAHWLMKEPELEEEALQGRQNGARLVIERRTMSDTAASVNVTLPSGKSRKVELTRFKPGIWRGQIEVAEEGVHKLSDGTLQAFAAIGSADPRETSDVHATADKLKPIVEASSGGIAWLSGSNGRLSMPRLAKIGPNRALAGSGWLGLKANGAYRVRAIQEIPLFGSLIALALLLAAFALVWYREGS